MEELKLALCEDDKEEMERLMDLAQAAAVPVRVTAFENGEAFLADYRPGRFDMVFMDIYMDGISGVEAVRRLREQEPELPVAFVTSSQDHALDGYRLKVAKYIEKPVTKEDMDSAIALAAQWREQAAVEVVLQEKKLSLPVNRLVLVEQRAEAQPAGFPFFRSHKSYLANLSHVVGIDQGLLVFCMKDGQSVYIRRDLLKKAKNAWEDWLFAQARKGAGL